MPELSELIREYSGLLVQQSRISERKERLRAAIAAEMIERNLKSTSTEHARVERTDRLKLLPKQEPVLTVLSSEDLFCFANFTEAGVKKILVPRYGREALIPLFDIEKTEALVIKRRPEMFIQGQLSSNGRPVKQGGDGLTSVKV